MTEEAKPMMNASLMRLILNTWGEKLQLATAIEEMAELTAVLGRILRGRDTDIEHLRDEIADVMIMVEQLRFMYGPEQVDERRRLKILRLLDRLK